MFKETSAPHIPRNHSRIFGAHNASYGFFGELTDPLVNRMYAKDVHSNLEKLKELLEAE